jgi:hypothetical protein
VEVLDAIYATDLLGFLIDSGQGDTSTKRWTPWFVDFIGDV